LTPEAAADQLLAEPLRLLRVPVSTYRVQLGPELTFSEASALVPYLDALGITDVYTSPFLETASARSHGYDVADHQRVRTELGGEPAFDRFAKVLAERRMGLLIDVVPNHMGIAGNRNAWWTDVLENGQSSPYASCFDIDWLPLKRELAGKVLLPILGDQYGPVLERGELGLEYRDGAFAIRYFELLLPVAPDTYPHILRRGVDRLEAALGPDHPALHELQSIITAFVNLPDRTARDPARRMERHREKETGKRRLATLVKESGEIRDAVDEVVRSFNGTPGRPPTFDLLDALLAEQVYRVASWRVAGEEINYRRFFDVNDLAAIRMEDPAVFEPAHRLVFALVRAGVVTGLRIDHPDGLYAPTEYLERLQRGCFVAGARRLGSDVAAADQEEWNRRVAARYDAQSFRRPFYVVAEKILGEAEPLPETWAVHGTTGYEFLAAVNGILVDRAHQRAMTETYIRITQSRDSFSDLAYETRKLMVDTSMASELNVLANRLNLLSEQDRSSRDFTGRSLRQALREIIACFPVYRTYMGEGGDAARDRDRGYIAQAIARAKRRSPNMSASIFDWIHDVLRGRGPHTDDREHLDFVMRFQQITGPVTAKGVEDTALYRYPRLASLNEVGSDPSRFGLSVPEFHAFNASRAAHWPWTLSATSTHDSKWSEDVRARIDVLSEQPQEWRERVTRWRRFNRRHRTTIDGRAVPDPLEEYLLYQALVGAWPIDVDRLREYFTKAMREAKVFTSWINPNPERDAAAIVFVEAILDESRAGRFLEDFQPFQARIAHFGAFNALAQVLTRLTAPGVPDTYQGTETWALNLVDPDNRRAVDWDLRRRMLDEVTASAAGPDLATYARGLVDAKDDGRIKMYVTWRALQFRRAHPETFLSGDYRPLDVTGAHADHAVAYARGGGAVVVVIPRLLARLGVEGPPLGRDVWGDTRVRPGGELSRARFRNIFTGETITVEGDAIGVGDALRHFPVALLAREAGT
jgi:(1->4)-alpha-D-glucan 1-alpha-D-glucosylmutase